MDSLVPGVVLRGNEMTKFAIKLLKDRRKKLRLESNGNEWPGDTEERRVAW